MSSEKLPKSRHVEPLDSNETLPMAAPDDAQIVCLLDVLGFESQLKRLGLAGLHTKYEVQLGRRSLLGRYLQ